MKNYSNIKSKLLREKLIEADKKAEQEMKEWWERILPRKGSVLRQSVDRQLVQTPK